MGKKVGPSLEKKELTYMLKASLCKEHTVMAAINQGITSFSGRNRGATDCSKRGLCFSLFGFIDLKPENTTELL